MHNAKLQSYAGQWVLKALGPKPYGVQTRVSHKQLSGTLVHPRSFKEADNGEFSRIHGPVEKLAITKSRWNGDLLVLTIGRKPNRELIPMRLPDGKHALLRWGKWEGFRLAI